MTELTVHKTDTASCLPDLSEKLPKVLLQTYKTATTVRSVKDIVARTSEPKLGVLINEAGATPTTSFIMGILAKMDRSMHLPNGLTEDNVRDIAKRLVTDPEITSWLTLPDIHLLCSSIEDGVFGKYSYRFGKDDFYECLWKYCSSRRQAHEEEAMQEAVKHHRELSSSKELLNDDDQGDMPLCYVVQAYPPAYVSKDKKERIYSLATFLHKNNGMEYEEAFAEAERRALCSK